jgi:hypothetical protein
VNSGHDTRTSARPACPGEITEDHSRELLRPAASGLARLGDPGLLGYSAKRAVRSSVVAARMVAGRGMLPGFLIVGGQRCGTTSLARALSWHPAVLPAALHLEVHYFDTGYHHGPDWYRAHFPSPARAALAAADGLPGAAPVAFESSPYYLFHPLAAARIARDLPGVKLLVLLRDPVERAYSAHAHEVSLGYETEQSFDRALEREDARLAGETEKITADPAYASHSHQHHAYRARGHYADQLTHLEAHVGRGSIHVTSSEEFFTAPEPAYDAILDFLGLPRLGYPPFTRRNARPRPAPMNPATRTALENHYRPHDDHLAHWLGHQPSWRT